MWTVSLNLTYGLWEPLPRCQEPECSPSNSEKMLEATFSWYFGIWLQCKTKRHRNPPAVELRSAVSSVTNSAGARIKQQLCSLPHQWLHSPSGCPPPRGGSGKLLVLCSSTISYNLQHNNAVSKAPRPFRWVKWRLTHTLHKGKRSVSYLRKLSPCQGWWSGTISPVRAA